ncbi:cell division protein FtsA [Lactobacillus rodentium]|uniref:Cell division protein FtsA n=1 Tax=Lactobacillus rodentium TaxID=947835 RepID=A0A2Z6T7J8_9LACO|nr:cell division protein FtsA [Lactobacillus rodentium]MCR1894372.1 cell division protein FtsA [Lactobacillus rodentium]GBG04671.1 cell division protein FtsA [Lactobacillus rodentium]
MDKTGLLVGLDIGTTSVKTVVADTSSNELRVIGAASSPTKGMRHGKIVDIDQTASSISSALKKVAEKTNSKIYRVVTGIPVGMLRLDSASGLINIGEKGQEVGDSDVKRVLASAISSATKEGQEPIAFLPNKFLIDGKTDVDDPRKMIAHSLEVHGILLTAPAADLHNIRKAIERAGYQNNFFVPTPLAIASVALDEGERTFGSIILDLGGGTTTATVIHENKIKYATIDLEGGNDITKDISVVLNTSKKEAEKIKQEFGYADPELTSPDNQFPVNVVGENAPQMVDEEYLSEIINARLEQILARIGKGLDAHDAFRLPGGVTITGGTSVLQGTDDIVKDVYDVKARIFQPNQIGLRNPLYAASFGVVKYAYDLADIDYLVNSVIYNTPVTVSSSVEEKTPEKMKFFKRVQSNSEIAGKEDYNKDTVASKQKNNNARDNKKNKKGLGDFFKKFFD